MSRSNETGDILDGTPCLLVLRTLLAMGTQHGYGMARLVDQTSGNMLELNQDILYPAPLRREQMGSISSKWGTSQNNRRPRFYSITEAGRKQLEKETRDWELAAEMIARFRAPESASP